MARPVAPSAGAIENPDIASRRRGSKSDLFRRCLLGTFEQLDRMPRHDGRYRVLVDELRVPIPPQQHAEIIEPGHDPLQLDSVDQKDRQRRLTFSDMIEKGVL